MGQHHDFVRCAVHPWASTMITSTQTSSVPHSICGSTVSIHGPTMIMSKQTSSFPQSIHSPTVITVTQTSGAQKANGIYYII